MIIKWFEFLKLDRNSLKVNCKKVKEENIPISVHWLLSELRSSEHVVSHNLSKF